MTQKFKVAFFEVHPWEQEYIKEKINKTFPANGTPPEAVAFFAEPLSLAKVDVAKDFEVISPFIYSKLDKEVLSKLTNLKMIATRSTGFDHIDASQAKSKGIFICNVPFYGENTVAEHAFALILALSRKLFDSIERAKKGDFNLEGLRGFDLNDKTLGIIGLGHIGLHVARIAKGFEMKVLAYDPKEDKKLAKKIGFEYIGLEDLLAKSDI